MSTHYKGTPRETLVLDTWIKLARASGTVFRMIRPSIEKHDLTISQFGTLETLWFLGPLTQRDIGKKLLVSGGNVVKVIDNLERDGLVSRVTNPQDRRSHIIHLTPQGESLISKMFSDHVQNVLDIFKPLSDEDARQLGTLCKTLGLGDSREQ